MDDISDDETKALPRKPTREQARIDREKARHERILLSLHATAHLACAKNALAKGDLDAALEYTESARQRIEQLKKGK